MTFAQTHADALAQVQEAGAIAVTFSRDTPATDSSGVATGDVTTQSVVVWCIDNYDGGDPAEYARLGLTQFEAPCLFGVPEIFGTEPAPGMTGTWANAPHAVRSCKPFRPAGETLTVLLIVQK